MSERDDLCALARVFCDEVDAAERSWGPPRGMLVPSVRQSLRRWRDLFRARLTAAERERAAADALAALMIRRFPPEHPADTWGVSCEACDAWLTGPAAEHDEPPHSDGCPLAAYRAVRGGAHDTPREGAESEEETHG